MNGEVGRGVKAGWIPIKPAAAYNGAASAAYIEMQDYRVYRMKDIIPLCMCECLLYKVFII